MRVPYARWSGNYLRDLPLNEGFADNSGGSNRTPLANNFMLEQRNLAAKGIEFVPGGVIYHPND